MKKTMWHHFGQVLNYDHNMYGFPECTVSYLDPDDSKMKM